MRLRWAKSISSIEFVILGDGGVRHQRAASHLVAAGARLDLGDRNGVTPIEMARQRGYACILVQK
ncbi:hypothetical protein [Bosea sp. PAMC 26642]|uniref:hypothetical protein n=1 Tax=Bosea sp. (strain PAMC 26642) TaxID=1792307 RepID=UPI00076FFB89|nr:hypothetical protein [Bosea sp. PAMC 26642]AMJ62583.1 hypothetical protein AXW83_21835 [Bosea sp. PAMC 26642]